MSDDSDSNDSANRTFAIVKPDALTPFKYQQIDALIKLNEFQIVRQKLVWLTKSQADALFPEKTSDSDYQDWIDYITCAPSLVLELARENAALFWHITMGLGDSSDGSSCDSDSIRGILAIDKIRNAVDGSGEPEDAVKQLALVFSDSVPEIPYDNFLMQHSVEAHSTLAIIKPDISSNAEAVSRVIRCITARGYTIKDRVEIQLTKNQASSFYAEHVGKPFFDGLIAHMTSGPVIALLVDGDDVIRGWRTMIGPTSPDVARTEAPQSIRALLGESGPRNAVHGSDSAESALRELSFFFFPRIQQQQQQQQQQEEEEPQSESQNPSAVEASEQATIEAAPVASTAGDDDEKKKKKRNKKSKRNNKRKQTVSSVGGDIASVSKTAETTTTTTAVQSDNSDKEAIPLAEEKPEDVAIEGSASENTGSNIHEASVDSILSECLEVQVPAAEEHAISEQPGEQAITEQTAEPVAEIIPETAVETVDERAVETVTKTVAESVAYKVSEPAVEQTAKDSNVPIITQSAEPAVSPVEDSMDATLAKQVDESVDEPEVESNTEQIDMPPSVPADTLEPARELLVPFESTNERTFGLIKPDAYPRYYKQIITQAIERGFTVVVQEEIQLTTEAAEEIYRDMSAYPVFPRIINSVTSGPSLALVLEGIDAISAWRSLVGPTNPRTAKIEARSSLRAKYGMDAQKNAVHASKDENDAIKSVNAVFFSLLEGNFQKLQPTDDPLAMTVSSQHNSDIGSAQTTPLAVPAATIPEEQHTTPVEDTAAETAQTDNTAEALVPSDIPVVSEEPIAADIPNIPNTAETTEAPLSVDDHVVQQELAATSDSAVLDDSVVSSQNTPVGETSVADEPAASEPPASSEVLSSLVEQISAESHMIDKEEPAFCADEPVTETLEPAAKIALVEDSTNVKPITEEKPTETKTTVTPQSKSSTVEKSIPFGNRLASSPFLQADRQLSQEANGVAKVVGRIKSPFLSNEKSDGSPTSTSTSTATAAATIAASINSPPKSVAAIRNAFVKVPEAKVDESSRGLRIDHSPSTENTAEIAVDDSQLETKRDRLVTAKESEKADDVSAVDREAKVAAPVDKTTTIDDTVEQSTEPSTEAAANAHDATAIVEETKKTVDEDASKETAKKTVNTTTKDTSTPTKTQAPTKTQTPSKAPVTPQSRTVASRPAPSTATASKTPVRKTTTSAAATSSPARSVASSTVGRSPSKPAASTASTARRPIATTALSTPVSSRTRPTAPSASTTSKTPSSTAAGATPRAGVVRRTPVTSTTSASRSTGTGTTPVRPAPGRAAPSGTMATRSSATTTPVSAATRTRPTVSGTATTSTSKAPVRTTPTAPTSSSAASARSRGSTSSSTSAASAPKRPMTKPMVTGSTTTKKPLTATPAAATGAARRTPINGTRVSSTAANGSPATPVRRPTATTASTASTSTTPRATARPAVPSAARQPQSTTASARTRPSVTAPARDANTATASRTTAQRTTPATRSVTARTPVVSRTTQATSTAPAPATTAARKPAVPSATSAGRPIRTAPSSTPGAARPVAKRAPVPASASLNKISSAKAPASLTDPESAQDPVLESESVDNNQV